jgi:hypothetical protein
MSASVQTHARFPRCVGTHTVVLFDPKSGRVHHLHHALLFDGSGPAPTAPALEAVARRNAARRGTPIPVDLEVLHLRDVPLSPGPHRVDLTTRQLTRGS